MPTGDGDDERSDLQALPEGWWLGILDGAGQLAGEIGNKLEVNFDSYIQAGENLEL